MKTFTTALAFSAALLLAGCSDAKPEEQPPARPAALMSAEAPTAASVEAVQVDENATDTPVAAQPMPSAVRQPTTRRPLESHTIGDRREQ